MSSLLLLNRRRAEPPASPRRKCLIFQWIGQSFNHCERCTKPLEEHLYHPPYGGKRPIFHIKAWNQLDHCWVWEPVGSLVEPRWRSR